jgi:hypothetical protein
LSRNDWIGISAIQASICFARYSMSAHFPTSILLLAAKTYDVSNEIVTILAGDHEIWHFGVGGLKKHSKCPLVEAGKPRKDTEWRCLEAR